MLKRIKIEHEWKYERKSFHLKQDFVQKEPFQIVSYPREKGLAPDGVRCHFQEAARGLQFPSLTHVLSINMRCVQIGGVLVDLLAGAQRLLAGEGSVNAKGLEFSPR